MESINYWQLLTGLGFLLFGLSQIESSLKNLAGRRFKNFIRRTSKNRIFSLMNGIFATLFLQSSSLVTLLVISFTGAGILTLSNSLGLILGANIGTTFIGWWVSAVGFGVNPEILIMQILTVGLLGWIFVRPTWLIHSLFGALIGFGLVILGLNYLKDSISTVASVLDLKNIQNLGSLQLFLASLLITAVMQSSSAMMSIILSAVHLNLIGLDQAIYLVIGADLGTTSTSFLTTIKASAVRKRVAMAHVIFNLGTSIVALILAQSILKFLIDTFSIENKLFAVTSFHSAINVLGVLVGLPLLGQFERLLVHLYPSRPDENGVSPISDSVDVLIYSAQKKVRNFELRVERVLDQTLHATQKSDSSFALALLGAQDLQSQFKSHYKDLKEEEDEIVHFIQKIKLTELELSDLQIIEKEVYRIRLLAESLKAVKDGIHTLAELRRSIDEKETALLKKIEQSTQNKTYKQIREELQKSPEQAEPLQSEFFREQQDLISFTYKELGVHGDSQIPIGSLLNLIKEIYLSKIAFLNAQSTSLFNSQKFTTKKNQDNLKAQATQQRQADESN